LEEMFAGKGKAELVYRIDMVEYLDKEFGGKAEKRRRREYSCRGEELRFMSFNGLGSMKFDSPF
jgi:hypothetical protein